MNTWKVGLSLSIVLALVVLASGCGEEDVQPEERGPETVSLSYERLPTFYKERDENGILGPPAARVTFGDNTQEDITVTATVRGATNVCPFVYQDVAYVLNEQGERGGRIPIFGYQDCPFTIDGPIQVTDGFEMREEFIIEIESASGSLLWVSPKSARPLGVTGALLAAGYEMFINTTWVFTSQGTEFVAGGKKYTTAKDGATVKFTRNGVVLDGILQELGVGS